MKNQIESSVLKKNVFALFWLFVFMSFSSPLFAADPGDSQTIIKIINDAWLWIKVVCFLAFVVIMIIGGLQVYAKTHGENPESFMKAASGWVKGLIFLLIFFSVVGGAKVLWDNTVGKISI